MADRLTLIFGGRHGGRAATTDQIAAFDFPAIRSLAGMPEKMRRQRIRQIADNVTSAAALAGELVVLSKPDLVERVCRRYDRLEPVLTDLARARDDAIALMELIGAVETRLAVALAEVEGEDPPPAA